MFSSEKLKKIKAEDLNNTIQTFTAYPHRITYYGKYSKAQLSESIKKYHLVEKMRKKPKIVKFIEQDYEQPKVFWSHYDMLQTEVITLAKAMPYDAKKAAIIRLFNEYFGGGMNSIVFQEIREAQGLAYSVFSEFEQTDKKENANYLYSYIGVQADKQKEALSSMFHLMQKLPESEQAFEIAKNAILKKLKS